MATTEPLKPNWFGPLAHYTQGEDWRVALLHGRPSHTIIFIKKGQGRALLAGGRHGINPNTLLSIPPATLFSLTLGRQSEALVLSVDDPSAMAFPKTPWLLRLRDVEAIGEVTTLFDAGMLEVAQARPYLHKALAGHASLFATWLLRQVFLDDRVLPVPDTATRLSARLFDVAAQSDPGLLGLRDHADSLDVSPTHLSRSCKAATGQTAAELLNERVLHQARMLLATGTFSVQDIARHLGFGTPAYFTRFIRSNTGHSPSQLRQKTKGASA